MADIRTFFTTIAGRISALVVGLRARASIMRYRYTYRSVAGPSVP